MQTIRQRIGDIMAFLLDDDQLAALDRMKNGCILYGGVGSGKSRTAIAYYYKEQGGGVNKLRQMVNPKDLYIITTAKKRDTHEWEGEMIPFLLSTDPERSIYKHKIVIDSWNNIKKYTDVKGAFFIFDEQRVVGDGPWSKAFINISKSNDWILLTATPGDQWKDYMSIFIANGFFKNKTDFYRKHCVMNRFYYGQVDSYINEYRLRRMERAILVPIKFKRKTYSHHEYIWVNYNIPFYKSIVKKRFDPYKCEPIVNAAGLCYALRRVVNTHESRINGVIEKVKECNRAIIFYNYDYELEMLRAIDWGEGFVVAEWNGHVHQTVPDSEKWVYLVNYMGGSEGWNCITTNTIIFFSQNYSYRTMVQAAGRIERRNTPFKDLYFYHFMTRSPIDLAINRALEAKEKFNEERFAPMYFKKNNERGKNL